MISQVLKESYDFAHTSLCVYVWKDAYSRHIREFPSG